MGRPRVLGNRPLTNAERQARFREKKRAASQPKPPSVPRDLKNPGQVLADWARTTLIIPTGHRNAGQPFVLPEYLVSFLDDAATHAESLLCIARKNAKSAAIAVYALARLCGPLVVPGWRGGCLSISKQKAGER